MPVDTAALRALADAATEGPWRGYIDRRKGNSIHGEGDAQTYIMIGSYPSCDDDTAFIAASRTAVPAMCAELDTLREQVAKLREWATMMVENNQPSPVDTPHMETAKNMLRGCAGDILNIIGHEPGEVTPC